MRALSLALAVLLAPSAALAQDWERPSDPPCEALAELYRLAVDGFAEVEADTVSSARHETEPRQIVTKTPRAPLLSGDDARLVYEYWAGDTSNLYGVTLPALAVDAGPDPTATATALLADVAGAVAGCLGESFEVSDPRGAVTIEERPYIYDPYVSVVVQDPARSRIDPSLEVFKAPTIEIYAFEEGTLADALAAEASADVAELFSTYSPDEAVRSADRIVVRFEVKGGLLFY